MNPFSNIYQAHVKAKNCTMTAIVAIVLIAIPDFSIRFLGWLVLIGLARMLYELQCELDELRRSPKNDTPLAS